MAPLHAPAITPSESLVAEVQREEPALRTVPGKATLLWKWAADDVTPWYPVTRFLANLCIKLV